MRDVESQQRTRPLGEQRIPLGAPVLERPLLAEEDVAGRPIARDEFGRAWVLRAMTLIPHVTPIAIDSHPRVVVTQPGAGTRPDDRQHAGGVETEEVHTLTA